MHSAQGKSHSRVGQLEFICHFFGGDIIEILDSRGGVRINSHASVQQVTYYMPPDSRSGHCSGGGSRPRLHGKFDIVLNLFRHRLVQISLGL